jgi:hypothetical protein
MSFPRDRRGAGRLLDLFRQHVDPIWETRGAAAAATAPQRAPDSFAQATLTAAAAGVSMVGHSAAAALGHLGRRLLPPPPPSGPAIGYLPPSSSVQHRPHPLSVAAVGAAAALASLSSAGGGSSGSATAHSGARGSVPGAAGRGGGNVTVKDVIAIIRAGTAEAYLGISDSVSASPSLKAGKGDENALTALADAPTATGSAQANAASKNVVDRVTGAIKSTLSAVNNAGAVLLAHRRLNNLTARLIAGFKQSSEVHDAPPPPPPPIRVHTPFHTRSSVFPITVLQHCLLTCALIAGRAQRRETAHCCGASSFTAHRART